MDRRAQRKKEIEEKRKRLAAYREKNKLKQQQQQPQSQSALHQLQNVNTLDDLLSTIETELPAPSPTPSLPLPGESSEPVQQPTESQTETKPLEAKFSPPTTTITSNVFSLHLPLKKVETYSKGINTIESVFHVEESAEVAPHDNEGDDSREIDLPIQMQGAEHAINEEITPELTEEEKMSIMQSENFLSFINTSSKLVERALFSVSHFDVFATYDDFSAESSYNEKHRATLEAALYDTKWTKNRSVTSLDWSKRHQNLLLVAYSASEASSSDSDGVVLVWGVPNVLERPEFVFTCQSPVTTAFFHDYQPTVVVGGTYSGQIVLWDTRAGSTPIQRSPLSAAGHTHPLYCMQVIGTENAHNVLSVSTDGKMCLWSIDNLQYPIEVLELHSKHSKSLAATAPVAPTCLAAPEGDANCFYIGSEESALYRCYRHGPVSGVEERFDGHRGPVLGVDFHTCQGSIDFSSLCLTSSTDWSIKLWDTKASTESICTFEESGDYIFDVQW